jgi:uncharacterized protein
MTTNTFFRLCVALGAAALLGAGCSTDYNKQVARMDAQWTTANWQGAAREASKAAARQKTTTSRDAVIWHLEQGTALRAAGQYKESIAAFNAAEEGANLFEEQTKKKATLKEATVLLTNPAMAPYEGYAYDKIMLNTYKAADYMQLGDFQDARVELNRALEKQTDAQALNDRRIEKAKREAELKKQKIDVDKIEKDTKFSKQWKTYYMDLDKLQFYANYVNPFSEYLRGLFLLCHPSGPSDIQEARKSFERVLGMSGENKFIVEDLKSAQQAAIGESMPPTTWVIFETGLAPTRRTIRIDVPTFIVTWKMPYVGVAFPRLMFHPDFAPSLTVQAGGTKESTVLLSSMDAIVGQEFKNDRPRVIIRTVASAMIKAGILYGAGEATKNEPWWVKLIAEGSVAAYEILENKADLRTWETLPKQIQICRFPTPKDRRIEIAAAGAPPVAVTIEDGVLNLVWVRSVGRGAPLLIKQCVLRAAASIAAGRRDLPSDFAVATADRELATTP